MAAERPREGERGELLAAGAVALTVLVYVLNARFDAEWGQGIHLVYTAAAALFVLSLARRSPQPILFTTLSTRAARSSGSGCF